MKRASSNILAVRSLQTMLGVISVSEENIEPIIPDGIYGSETMSAVASYQRNHALPVTGITDQETWDSMVRSYDAALTEYLPPEAVRIESMEEPFCPGAAGYGVMVLQCMLHGIAKEYNCICCPDISGKYDTITARAVTELQQLCALPVTGEVDKTTWKHLAMQFPGAELSSRKENVNKSRIEEQHLDKSV